jgi:hypothetical protein
VNSPAAWHVVQFLPHSVTVPMHSLRGGAVCHIVGHLAALLACQLHPLPPQEPRCIQTLANVAEGRGQNGCRN